MPATQDDAVSGYNFMERMMYVILWWSPSGRSFIHVGTHKGIRELLTKELNGCRWQSVGRRKFNMQRPEEAAA